MSDTAARIVRQPDGTYLPSSGWEWCGYCQRDGFYVTSNEPDYQTECGFCNDGLIPTRPVAP